MISTSRFLILCIWCYLDSSAVFFVSAEEYCLSDSFNATCGSNEVILMTSAMHGRMSVGRCVKMEYDKVSCQKDVLPHLDGACSGRQTCVYSVARLREVAKICNPDLSTYLEATYKCVQVQTSDVCPPEGRVSMTTPQSGHLMLKAPDHVLPRSAAGTTGCPWTIAVDPHQKLRFYLLSFGSEQQVAAGGGGGACSRFVVFEESRRVQERLCRAPVRQTILYTSTTNRVSVSQTTSVPEKYSSSVVYMLQYEAIGCPLMRVEGNSWVTQDEHTATVRCNRTDETWFLSCDGRQWKGEIGNCTPEQEMLSEDDERSQSSSVASFSYGLVTAVVIGVLLGVIIGAVPLGLAYVCLRRRWKQPSAGFVRDNVYDPDFYKAVDEEGRPIYPALMDQTPAGRRLLQSVEYCYGARYPPAAGGGGGGGGQCPSGGAGGHHLVDRLCWEQGEGVRGRSIDCLDHVEATQLPVTGGASAGSMTRCTRSDHVYESASFSRAQMMMMTSAQDQQQQQQHSIGLLPVYYEVEGKRIQCTGNPVSASS